MDYSFHQHTKLQCTLQGDKLIVLLLKKTRSVVLQDIEKYNKHIKHLITKMLISGETDQCEKLSYKKLINGAILGCAQSHQELEREPGQNEIVGATAVTLHTVVQGTVAANTNYMTTNL